MSIQPLAISDLALAAMLLLINGAISMALSLKIERALAIAALRMTVQLALVGTVLKTLFATVSPWLTVSVIAIMLVFAGYEIRARQERVLGGWWGYGLGTITMVASALMVTIFALATQIHADPWYDPRYVVPLLGMILGNAMTGVSLGLNSLTDAANVQAVRIEARLALGETRFAALDGAIRGALRNGLMPTINAMSATGLVFLPGMMTGQILAGIDPNQAVKYQILIMFLIAGATGIGVTLSIYIAASRITDSRHRLRLDRMHRRAV